MTRTVAVLFAAVQFPIGALAQQPAAASATTRTVVFSDMMAANAPAYIALERNVAYRVEVVPSAAILIETRMAGPAPLALRPMAEEAGTQGGDSYIVVPTVSGDYRVEVYNTTDPVHVRIESDPRETALLAGRATSSVAMLTVGAQAVVMSGLQTEHFSSVPGAPSVTSEATIGEEVCLGLAVGRTPGMPKLGGCAFTAGEYRQSGGGYVEMFGVAPSWLLRTYAHRVEVSASGISTFGRAVGGTYRTEVLYMVVGGGLDIGVPLPGLDPGAAQMVFSPGLVFTRCGGYEDNAVTPTRRFNGSSAIAFRFGYGIHVRL